MSTQISYARLPYLVLSILFISVRIAGQSPTLSVEKPEDGTRNAELSAVIVTNSNDDGPGSLRQAIRDAGAGGTVGFSALFSQPQTITLTTGELVVGNINIVGPGADLLTISGNNSSSVIQVLNSGPVQISGMTITKGYVRGIYLPFGGRLTLDGMVVYGNSGSSQGSGLYGFASALTVSNSTFYGNSTSAIYNDESTLTVTNTTISGNVGYGIISLGQATITNCTITNNALGGMLSYSGATVGSSIIAGNLNNANQPDVVHSGGSSAPPIVSNGYNLIGNRGSVSFNGPGDQAGTSLGLLSPQLGLLRNNGGPTPTHLPLPGSRAIDAGNSSGLTNDQRGTGFLRVVDLIRANAPGGNGSDIGAVELQTEPPLATAGIFGKLRRPSGNVLSNTRVYLVDQQGQIRNTTSSSFGEFSFTGLPVGQTYSLGVLSKRYRFAAQSLFLDTNIGDLNLIGLE
ncbi:MAG: choice-of-anchor Q domain-containing protein [Pyrinomonadaceae bacterium]